MQRPEAITEWPTTYEALKDALRITIISEEEAPFFLAKLVDHLANLGFSHEEKVTLDAIFRSVIIPNSQLPLIAPLGL